MILGLCGPAADPISGQMTLQNLHTFLSSSLDEQHQPQVFGQEQRPIVLVADMLPLAPSSLNGQENDPIPSTQAQKSPPPQPSTASQLIDHLPGPLPGY